MFVAIAEGIITLLFFLCLSFLSYHRLELTLYMPLFFHTTVFSILDSSYFPTYTPASISINLVEIEENDDGGAIDVDSLSYCCR